jgi:hypothetical protein
MCSLLLLQRSGIRGWPNTSPRSTRCSALRSLPRDPVAAVDKDVKGGLAACGGATALCGAAVFFLPLSGLCEGAMGACISAVGCVIADCQGDG